MSTKTPSRKRIKSPFGANLKCLIEERALTQRSVAEIAGVGVATINDWLNGAQPNDLEAVSKICKAFNCSFEWILTGKVEKVRAEELTLSEVFDIEDDPSFSGIFMIEAKRLKRRG